MRSIPPSTGDVELIATLGAADVLIFAYGANHWFAAHVADVSRTFGVDGAAAWTSAFVIMALAMVPLPRMELRQLEAFVAVTSELHFGRAVEKLYATADPERPHPPPRAGAGHTAFHQDHQAGGAHRSRRGAACPHRAHPRATGRRPVTPLQLVPFVL
jgi:hypothetical protein